MDQEMKECGAEGGAVQLRCTIC